MVDTIHKDPIESKVIWESKNVSIDLIVGDVS